MSRPPFDLGQVFEQARQLGEKLQGAREALKHRTVSANVGGGMVEVHFDGSGAMTGVRIDPQAVDPRDVEMLQDLITAGVNQALRRCRELQQEELERRTGLPLGSLLGGFGGLGGE